MPELDLIKIEYIIEDFKSALDLDRTSFINNMLSKKFIHWEYEQEYRRLVEFKEREFNSDLIFERFSERMVLKEVLIGHRSGLTKKELLAIDSCKGRVEIRKVAPSLSKYAMEKID